jgi:hypothetical protein
VNNYQDYRYEIMGRPRLDPPTTASTDAEDLEAQKAWAFATFKKYNLEPLDDRPMIATLTDSSRYRNMESWKS